MKSQLLGVGVDIVHIPRMARFVHQPRFLEKICRQAELDWIPNTQQGLAQAWAAKEAVAKTLGTGFWQVGVEWTDICLLPNWSIQFFGKAQKITGLSTVELSFREDGDYMIATAMRWAGSSTSD